MRTIALAPVYILVAILNVSAQPAEHEAIKKTLRDETAAFYARNVTDWQAQWIHDPNATAALVSNSAYRYLKGWEDIAGRVTKSIQANPKPMRVELAATNFIIDQQGDLAWVEYDQTVTGEGFKEVSHEYRRLVKTAGAWKIVSQVHIAADAFGRGEEENLNETGYSFLTSGKVKDAIEVLSVNVRLFPDSWNAYDSLGEAYATAGQKDLAIKNYEKSLQLNPKNDNAKAALTKLKGQ